MAQTSAQLASSADQTGKASEDIARSIQDVANSADQSATASQEIAHGSEHQAHSATAAATEMEHLHCAIAQVKQGGEQQQAAAEQASANMRQAAQAAEEVAEIGAADGRPTAQQASAVATTGSQAVAKTVASMSRIQEQVQVSSAKITELGQMGQAIGAIVETITQTRRADQPPCPQCRH